MGHGLGSGLFFVCVHMRVEYASVLVSVFA